MHIFESLKTLSVCEMEFRLINKMFVKQNDFLGQMYKDIAGVTMVDAMHVLLFHHAHL